MLFRSEKSESKPLPNTTEKIGEGAPVESSVPMLKIFKKHIPSDVLKNLEEEHVHHTLFNLLVDEICSSPLLLDQRHAIGRTDVAFYLQSLPEQLKPFAKGLNQQTTSSSKLLQAVFSSEFRSNTGWTVAKILYANAIINEEKKSDIALGENDSATKEAARLRLKALASGMSQSIFGDPISIKNSPLPKRLIDDLIYADQKFHEKLLNDKTKQDWSTQQIRDARCSLFKLLCVTRLLMPMVANLARRNPSQLEVWCLGLILQTFLKSASVLSNEILVTSFVRSNMSLQKRANEKEKHERIQGRTKNFKTRKPTHHVRSRSADTTPIDLSTLMSPEEVKKKRALEKTQKTVSELFVDDEDFANVIKQSGTALEETEQIRKAESDLKDFSPEQIAQLEQILAEREVQEMIDLLPEGDLTLERAQPLPDSTTDLVEPIYTEQQRTTPGSATETPEKSTT